MSEYTVKTINNCKVFFGSIPNSKGRAEKTYAMMKHL